MSHELEILEDGTAAMAYAETNGAPWHTPGTPVHDGMTADEMAEAARMNWGVELKALMISTSACWLIMISLFLSMRLGLR